MKRVLLGSIAVLGLLISMPLERAAAQLRQPTVDEQFRDRAPAELPLLNPPQTKAPNGKRPEAVAIVGPAYLGVTFNTDERDAVVRSVTPGSPAAQAGLQPSDVIESIQGRQVRTSQDVLDAIARMRPGEMLEIEFSRRMSLRTQAALSTLPGASQRTAGYPPDVASEHEPLPAPANGSRGVSTTDTYKQSNRYAAPQDRSGSASGQRRNYNSNQNDSNRQQDNVRRILGLGRRRG